MIYHRLLVQAAPVPVIPGSSPATPLSKAEIERIHALVLDLASVERREQVRYSYTRLFKNALGSA